jgi:hypothetical protein
VGRGRRVRGRPRHRPPLPGPPRGARPGGTRAARPDAPDPQRDDERFLEGVVAAKAARD